MIVINYKFIYVNNLFECDAQFSKNSKNNILTTNFSLDVKIYQLHHEFLKLIIFI